MTQRKQQAGPPPSCATVRSRDYVLIEPLAFDTIDDARAAELTQSILEQRAEVLAYLTKR